ncbi:GntR family transcriptional regulator, partial [Streptomyces sp. NPDC052644]
GWPAMAYEIPTPKYLRVLNTLRKRIEDGDYVPGAALPSENQLSTEFGVSRPTVLKALGILKQDGWIESQQGKGSFVRGRPVSGRTSPVLASPRIAAELQIPDGTPVYERRRRTVSEAGPVDLVSTFVPVDIAVGTDITKPDPIPGGLLDLIARHKGLRADYATERMTARRVNEAEAVALDVPADESVLSVVITVHQASGDPIMASVLVMPGSRHEIEDTYALS